ncbi:hypothetical protein [Streptomyces mexicanus]|uniref:hypothetical protein n=1 Tax=Streptomyces mexicanus TaxID=178566 RepID=UPI000AB62EBC
MKDNPDARHGAGVWVVPRRSACLAHRGELIEKAEARQPDLVVRESPESSGVPLAEHLGIRLVALDIAPLAITRDTDIPPWLNPSRGVLGPPTMDDLSSVSDSR